jgi:hypothetical protein
MNEYVINVRLSEMSEALNAMKRDINVLIKSVKNEEELWDGSDIIRNWKVSERTLSNWRKNKVIGYVQIKKKIYYPREARERFLLENLRGGGTNDKC